MPRILSMFKTCSYTKTLARLMLAKRWMISQEILLHAAFVNFCMVSKGKTEGFLRRATEALV